MTKFFSGILRTPNFKCIARNMVTKLKDFLNEFKNLFLKFVFGLISKNLNAESEEQQKRIHHQGERV